MFIDTGIFIIILFLYNILCINEGVDLMLSLHDLQGHIKNGTLLPFYIFTGEEIELQNIYLRRMGEVVRVDKISEVYTKITSKLITNKTYKIYVCRDDSEFIRNEKAWKEISKKINNATLVLQITTPDKRSKIYKHFQDTNIVEFNHMTTKQLVNTINKSVDGTTADLTYLVESCNNDYNTILNYLDIFKRLGITKVTQKVVDEFISKKETATVFELADAVMELDGKKCFKLLDLLLEDKNNAMGIIYAIHNQLHKCVLVEGHRGQPDIAKKTGINSWIVSNILYGNKIKPANLLKALRLVQKYDSGIKTGKYNDAPFACYCLVTEILSL